jgi:hypothetical protein
MGSVSFWVACFDSSRKEVVGSRKQAGFLLP